MKPRIIGISGPSCSGKSTVARAVRDAVGGSVIVQQDWYFRDPDECPPNANFCEPRWLHADRLVRDIAALAGGKAAEVPVMDFATFRRVGTRRMDPAPLVIVEGMTIFRITRLSGYFTSKYYIDPEFKTLAERKRSRDAFERHKVPEIIEAQLQWIADEYRRDASIRDRADVTVLNGSTPVSRLVEAITGTL